MIAPGAGDTCRHLYVHVPFCARRCSYCDFSIAVRQDVPVASFVQAIGQELAIRRVHEHIAPLDTLYLGGGTPSHLGAGGVARLLDTLTAAAPLAPGAEVTLEANPEDITPDAVRAWREAGVTRLSIGVQSFDDAVLRWMHRVHDAHAAVRAVHVAREGGLASMSLDLIFALPVALERQWERDLDAALALEPEHISLYGLTVEPHTPLGRWSARGEVAESPEECYESEFLLAHQRLGAAGLEHYEVSNFARPGQRAVHNSAYWKGVPYVSVGPSAHGFDGDVRRWNIGAYAAWLAAIGRGEDPLEGSESLSAANRMAETVYLGLRTVDGLALLPNEQAAVAAWRDAGWIESVDETDSSRVRCTPLGWMRLDRLAADLTALRSHS